MRRSRVKTTTSRSVDGAESYSRALGVVETPRAVVTMMVNLALDNVSSHLSVLEPACGICPFLTALREARGPNSDHDRYVGVEVRPRL